MLFSLTGTTVSETFGIILATLATFDKTKIVHLGGALEQKKEETRMRQLCWVYTKKRTFSFKVGNTSYPYF